MKADDADLEKVLPEVAHLLYADAYTCVLEGRGESPPPGVCIVQTVPRDSRAIPLLRQLISRIEDVWHTPIAKVFAAMGLTKNEDLERALADLVLGCVGHGVTLDDDFEMARKRAEIVLGREFKSVPVREEGQEFWEIASETIERIAMQGLCD